MTTTKQQKIRIGLFAISAGVLFGIVLVVFAGLHFWQDNDRYYIVFGDTVYGLEAGADVHLNGMRVGSVATVEIDPVDIAKVRVAIDIDESTPVRADTQALLQMKGITGLKVIDLRGGTLQSPRLAVGGIIPVGETILDKLERKALAVVDETTQMMTTANQMVERAQLAVSNLAELTDPKQLGDIVAQTRATAHNLAQASAAMRSLIDENRAGLRASVAAIEHAAKRTASMVDDNNIKAAVSDLRQASRSFKELAREVRQKPSRLLFSKPEADRKLP